MPVHTYRDIPAAGTTLALSISGTPTIIDGATDISWDGFKRGVRTPTTLLSPAVVKKPGMTDFGQIKCKVYYDPNNSVHQIIDGRITETAANYSANLDTVTLTWADGYTTPSNVVLVGFFSEFAKSATDPETGTVTADTTFEVTNVTAFNAGSPPYYGG